ncbi:MAG: cholest-4-en-3-one 26-monooxygenase [Actinomycetota bacterium]|jgi:cytochrome P450 family 142 subfamily A polypeptide 1
MTPEIRFSDGEFWAGDHHRALTWMREHSPVHWDGEVWGITRYDDLKEISKHPELYSNAGGIRPDSGPVPMMIDMDDPEHFKRRKLVNKGFTPRRVSESEPAVRAACDEIIDAIAEKGECDFVMDIAAWLPMIMIGDALGVAPDERATLLRWSDDMLSALSGAPDAAEKAMTVFIEYDAWCRQAIADRRAEPRDDLMSVLVHADVDGDKLTDDEIIHESLLILIGGDETTRHVITGGMYQLLLHPEQKQRLVDDPTAIPVAVEEMLRWVSPIKNMARTVTEDVTLRGKKLEAGQKLVLLYPSANRDERVFADPFTFDAARQPNEHVAFGFGTHYCLGNSLARVELRVMFEQLLARLPDMELADVTEPRSRAANFISGYEEMPVRFTPTSTSTAAVSRK